MQNVNDTIDSFQVFLNESFEELIKKSKSEFISALIDKLQSTLTNPTGPAHSHSFENFSKIENNLNLNRLEVNSTHSSIKNLDSTLNRVTNELLYVKYNHQKITANSGRMKKFGLVSTNGKQKDGETDSDIHSFNNITLDSAKHSTRTRLLTTHAIQQSDSDSAAEDLAGTADGTVPQRKRIMLKRKRQEESEASVDPQEAEKEESEEDLDSAQAEDDDFDMRSENGRTPRKKAPPRKPARKPLAPKSNPRGEEKSENTQLAQSLMAQIGGFVAKEEDRLPDGFQVQNKSVAVVLKSNGVQQKIDLMDDYISPFDNVIALDSFSKLVFDKDQFSYSDMTDMNQKIGQLCDIIRRNKYGLTTDVISNNQINFTIINEEIQQLIKEKKIQLLSCMKVEKKTDAKLLAVSLKYQMNEQLYSKTIQQRNIDSEFTKSDIFKIYEKFLNQLEKKEMFDNIKLKIIKQRVNKLLNCE